MKITVREEKCERVKDDIIAEEKNTEYFEEVTEKT